MALFRKRPTYEYPPDVELPFFRTDEADRFRRAFGDAFREQGLEVTVHAQHVTDADGREFGMYNAAAVCHSDDRGERAWKEILQDHAARILRSMEAKDDLSDEEILMLREQYEKRNTE